MTTTTTIATTAINIISALPKWIQWSLELNGNPDGWVPLHCLELTAEEIDIAYEANIIDVETFDDGEVRFIEENAVTIYNWLK